MADDKRQDSTEHREVGRVERLGESNGDEYLDSSSVIPSSNDVGTSTDGSAGTLSSGTDDSGLSSGGPSSGSRVGLADRLSEILVGNGDLYTEQSDRENNFLQWLQALDMQVMGACRTDERLKPFLKLNTPSGGAEEQLLAHIGQHFEATEVGLLARCLCVPLVSIRVGKVMKQGTMLCPTSSRGILNLMLLPSSDLRITFLGDDGQIERIATLSRNSECSAVAVHDIAEDKSGRSFLIIVPSGEVFYFWCSEKSKLLGIELLEKMKDLLRRKPTLAELTDISESRLECFAVYLRAYLIGSNVSPAHASTVLPGLAPDARFDIYERGFSTQSYSTSGKPMRSRQNSGQALKTQTVYQGSLSPRSSSFKEGIPRNFSSLRSSSSREKLRRRGDSHLSNIDNLASAAASITADSALTASDKGKDLEAFESDAASTLSFLESLERSAALPILSATSHHPTVSSRFSPYYCWCPPCPLPSAAPIQFPISLTEPLSLPPISSLLPVTRSASLLTQMPPFNASDVTPVNFPALLPDPLLRLPFSTQSSQQFPTFTPLMCDPIVHIPVIDVCSSGQGYLVSAGPAIATSISPLHPKFVSPLMPESESLADKGARETLRLLLERSTQSSAPLMDVLPAVLNRGDGKQGIVVTGSRGIYTGIGHVLPAFLNHRDDRKQGIVTGSRGLYCGASDVEAIAKSIASAALVTASVTRDAKNCGSSGAREACQDEMYKELEGSAVDLQGYSCLRNEETED